MITFDRAAVGSIGICAVQDAKVGRRKMLLSLVDQAAGQAVRGQKPRVQAFPGDLAASTLLELRAYAASPGCEPELAQMLSTAVVQVAKQAQELRADGHVPCLLLGFYPVVGDPPPIGDQEVRWYDSAGNLTHSYPVKAEQ